MEFDREVIRFNIFEAMKYHSDAHSNFAIDVIDFLVRQVFEPTDKGGLKVALNMHPRK